MKGFKGHAKESGFYWLVNNKLSGIFPQGFKPRTFTPELCCLLGIQNALSCAR